VDNINIEIPREIIQSARLTTQDLKRELALVLFQQNKISFGKAKELAGLNVWTFQQLLGERGINIHYDVDDFNDDLQNLEKLNRL